MKKTSNKEIEKLYKKYNLVLLEQYKNIDYSLECIDENGYKYKISPFNLRARKSLNMFTGAFNNKNPFKEYNILHFVDREGNGSIIKNISKNIDTDACIFQCRICQREFKQLFKTFRYSNNKCCSQCLKRVKKSKSKGADYIRNIFNKAGYELLENENKGTHYAYYVMDKEGYKGRMLLYSAKKKSSSIEKFHYKNIYSIQNINLFLKKNNIDLLCTEKSGFNTYKRLQFKCSCGNLFYCTFDNVKSGKYRCNECSRVCSNNEYTIKKYLDFLGIEYIQQYNTGKYKTYKNLYFDFFIPKLHLIIEVDGEQHYMPICFGGITEIKAQKNLELQKIRDDIKNLYCKENNIRIVRISYIDIQNNKYKDILSTEINDLRK